MTVAQNENQNVGSTCATIINKAAASNTAPGLGVNKTNGAATSRAVGLIPPAKRALGDITNAARDVIADPPTSEGFGAVSAAAHNGRNAANPAAKVRRTDVGAMKAVFATGSSRQNEAGTSSNTIVPGRPAASTASPMSTGTAPRRTSERLAGRLLAQRARTAAETSSSGSLSMMESNRLRLGLKLDFMPMPVDTSASDDEVSEEGALTPCGVDMMPDDVVDIDEVDHMDHLMVAQFAVRIHSAFLKREMNFMVDPNYMVHQEDITVKMRAILVDWLVDVHGKFKLRPETLFLTVNIIDRYLSSNTVVRRKLQLVGVTAMLIASKYEEIYAPEVGDFVFISDQAYSKREILAMEATILNRLDFDVTVPYSITFMHRVMKASHALSTNSSTHGYLTHYLVELALVDSDMLRFRPSMISAAACHLAGKLCRREFEWDSTMKFHSGGYTAPMLADCEKALRRLLEIERNLGNSNKLTAVRRKFSSAKFNDVSGLINKMLAKTSLSNAMDICPRSD